MKTRSTFLQRFTSQVASGLGNDHRDNYDETRFGAETAAANSARTSIKQGTIKLLKRKGYQHVSESAAIIRRGVDFVAPHLARLERLNGLLADEQSQTLLADLMAFRALGYRRVKLPFNTPGLWHGLKQVEALASTSDVMDAGFRSWRLQRIDLASFGIPVSLYSTPGGAHNLFVAQQYRCDCALGPIEASPGDYVVDAGGCWGDSALYFAHKVAESGRVFTFEFMPTNLRILQRNLQLNPRLRNRIDVVEKALWDRSGHSLSYTEAGPGTTVSGSHVASDNQAVPSISLDDFANARDLPRLNFVKMDIEGAELAALKGAEDTLRRFKPKLAICVYHRLEDFFDIPDFLDFLGLGYHLFLRHFTIHSEETVLFARVE